MSSYQVKISHFREVLERHRNDRRRRLFPTQPVEAVAVRPGYKFDALVATLPTTTIACYMVESRTETIFGMKSLTQVNRRRQYGTLDTVDQYDWSDIQARPLPGSAAERTHETREQQIKSTQKKRGRKPKLVKLVVSGKK